MAQIGDSFNTIINALVPGSNWSSGSDKGIDGKRRVRKGDDQVKVEDVNELRDAIYNFATIAAQGVDLNMPTLAFKTDISLRQAFSLPNWRVLSGAARVTNAAEGWGGSDLSHNYFDLYPPTGYTMQNLVACTCSVGAIFFNGDVNGDDSFWCIYHYYSNRIRFICNNSENREPAIINYLTLWSRP